MQACFQECIVQCGCKFGHICYTAKHGCLLLRSLTHHDMCVCAHGTHVLDIIHFIQVMNAMYAILSMASITSPLPCCGAPMYARVSGNMMSLDVLPWIPMSNHVKLNYPLYHSEDNMSGYLSWTSHSSFHHFANLIICYETRDSGQQYQIHLCCTWAAKHNEFNVNLITFQNYI